MMDEVKLLVAIVDDDAGVRRALSRLLRSFGCETLSFATGEAFLAGLGERSPVWAILDQQLPGMPGTEILDLLRQSRPDIQAMIVTAVDQPGLRERCLSAGAAAFLLKPISADALAGAMALPGASAPDG